MHMRTGKFMPTNSIETSTSEDTRVGRCESVKWLLRWPLCAVASENSAKPRQYRSRRLSGGGSYDRFCSIRCS